MTEVDERMNRKRNVHSDIKIEEVRLETFVDSPVVHEIFARKKTT
jgi:hypothetical protein